MPDPVTDPTPPAPAPPAPTPPAPTVDPPAPDGLGDAGKRAIANEREARKAAEDRAKALEDELAKHRQASMSDQEKAIEAAKVSARAESDTKWLDRIVRAEAKAAAAGKVVDPDVAVRLLDLSKITVTDGVVDSSQLDAAIAELVAKAPYLAAATPTPGRAPTPTVPTGPRGDGKGSISQDQLKTMAPSEIAAAYARGDLDHLVKG